MRYFIYKLKAPTGHIVQYVTEQKKASDLIAKHGILVDWFEKKGWKVLGKEENTPEQATTAEKKFCSVCGKEMAFKSGTSKSGKKWGGWFCENRDHPPIWK